MTNAEAIAIIKQYVSPAWTPSKTFPGIARAMAEQWGGIVPPKEET